MEQNKELETAKTLGIVALVCAFLFPLAGIICGHISLGKYKKLGEAGTDGKGLAKAGLILSYIFIVLGILITIGYVVAIGAAVSSGALEGLEGLEIPTE